MDQKVFNNHKKNCLEKLDQSKKGNIDLRAVSLIHTINGIESLYTTSSCSGRVYLWRTKSRRTSLRCAHSFAENKKNEIEWVKMSHDLIDSTFFILQDIKIHEDVWLRYEAFIIHVVCITLNVANRFLQHVKTIYKKSSILTMNNKVVVEIRASQFIEMPYVIHGSVVFSGDVNWLIELINFKLEKNWVKMETLRKHIQRF
jgi:tRNA wybutosine-synthesizing protein 3